jgi:hypothetical protein
MKTIFKVVFMLLVSIATCYGQENSIDIFKFRLDGLEYYSNKEAIIKKLGQPKRIVEPDYECGFYSEREQGNKYYKLHYGQIIFIGNEKEQYAIETMEFSPDGGKTLTYGQWKLSGKTTTKDFVRIFGKSVLDKPLKYNDGEIGTTLFHKGADVGIMFFFKSGYLVRIAHYSPC